MKNVYLFCFFIYAASFYAPSLGATLSDDFVRYHLQVAMEEIEDEDIFNMIHTNILNLQNANIVHDSAEALIFLIEAGHKIDPYNMALLIETLDYANALSSAALSH